VERELDPLAEAENTRLVGCPPSPVRVPAVVAASARAVALEWIDGVPLDLFLDRLRELPAERRAPLFEEMGLDLPLLARRVLSFSLQSFFRRRLFLTDLRASDVLLLPAGQLGMVDFGAAVFVTQAQAQLQADLVRSLCSDQPEALARVLWRATDGDRIADDEEAEADLVRLVAVRLAALGDPAAPRSSRSLSALFSRALGVMQARGLRLRPGQLDVFRMWISLDHLLLEMNPTIDLAAELRAYMSREALERALEHSWFDTARDAAWSARQLADLAPEGVAWLRRTLRATEDEWADWRRLGALLFAVLTPFTVVISAVVAIRARSPAPLAACLAVPIFLVARRWLSW
jgi:predicted unusual protein kinase regulating ubiquinone biosynthesis (AarF/ABC1/UbiB family)